MVTNKPCGKYLFKTKQEANFYPHNIPRGTPGWLPIDYKNDIWKCGEYDEFDVMLCHDCAARLGFKW